MQAQLQQSTTSQIAKFIVDTKFIDIPEDVVHTIKNAYIDTIGVAVAGKFEKCVQIVERVVQDEQPQGHVTVWGQTSFKTSASFAALVNGTMAHALDFDDLNSIATHAHPSAALIPAIIAAAEETNATGQDLITAYFVGFEVMAHIGRTITYNHYKFGWHGTATIGTLGCTAAVAKIYNLSIQQIEHAIGIAVTNSSGTRQNFGTMTKPYHAGKAAQAAIISAKLARQNFTANRQALEAPLGFYALFSNEAIQIQRPIGQIVELQQTKLSLKKYPCCFGSHRALTGIKRLQEEQVFDTEAIKKITVIGPVHAFTPLIHTEPKTGLEGKFSLEFPIAHLLLIGDVTVESFNDETVLRDDIQQLICKIERQEDPSIFVKSSAIDEGYIELIVELQSGEQIREKVFHPKGSIENPLTDEEIVNKFLSCVKNRFSSQQAQQLLDNLSNLQQVDSIHKITRLL